MINTIKCTKCGNELEVTQALRQEIESQVLIEERKKNKDELDKAVAEAEERAASKKTREFELKLKKFEEDSVAEKDRNQKLLTELSESLKEIRELKYEKDRINVEWSKKTVEIEEKATQKAKKEADDEHRLKDLEKDKQNADLKKQVEELKRKIEQGSQQNQGEVLELELEEILKSTFTADLITPVAKGVRGTDLIQEVCDKYGNKCGTILWESKNARWSDAWLTKLREDQRSTKAQIAVLVSVDLPKNITTFSFQNGVWITCRDCLIPLAQSLRMNIGQVFHARKASEGKNEKMEVLYNYLTSTDFQHRVEAIVEAFSERQQELEREKRWFASKWAKEEKSIRAIVDNTYGMYGDLQGIVGNEKLPQLESLKMIGDGESSE